MAFLTKKDLTPPLYQEVIDEITRNDDTIVDKAIASAIGEMKGYLNRYDLIAIFGDNKTDPATISNDGKEVIETLAFYDEYLFTIAKDIASWHLIKLSNPNIQVEMFRTAYEDAIKYLIKVMKGEADPAWPLRKDDPATPLDEAGLIGFSSNLKRKPFY